MYNAPNVPDWEWIDITAAFDYLFNLLENLWVWSGENGIVFYGESVSWRNIMLVWLVVGVLIKRIVGDFDLDNESAIEESRQAIENGGYFRND